MEGRKNLLFSGSDRKESVDKSLKELFKGARCSINKCISINHQQKRNWKKITFKKHQMPRRKSNNMQNDKTSIYEIIK